MLKLHFFLFINMPYAFKIYWFNLHVETSSLHMAMAMAMGEAFFC